MSVRAYSQRPTCQKRSNPSARPSCPTSHVVVASTHAAATGYPGRWRDATKRMGGAMRATDQMGIVRELLRKSGQSKRMIDERLRIFDQMPFLTDELRRSHIQLLPDDPEPEKIDPALIRKSSAENCLLSPPFRDGHVVYFNILKSTDEIAIDHASDHFVG